MGTEPVKAAPEKSVKGIFFLIQNKSVNREER